MEYKDYEDALLENQLQEAALKYNYLSPEDYLAFERSSVRDKHELHEGYLVTMQGASMNHNKIVANLLGGIVPYLKGNRCQVFPGDMRVYIPTAGSFTYPDISILCDEPDVLDDTYLDTIRNPTVIIEVLSPSTENYDRGKKFFIYRQIPALKEYILISTTSCSIRASHKQADGSWKFNDLNGKESILSIPTIQYQCPLAEVYDRVLF
ncbi:MAG TPA: Uma2 family endonuclease [Chitinophagaceae bacterium]